jgi:mitochondrial fission protein ELM1
MPESRTHKDPARWLVLQDGRKGTDGQAEGLAVALKIPYDFQSLSLPRWQFYLPPLVIRNYVADKLYQSCAVPPAGVIGAGRRAAYGLLAASRKWPGIITIQIQDPRIDPKYFSYVVAPEHDGLAGANVIPTLGGLHRINRELLAHAAQTWEAQLSTYQSPRVAVLIGGNNKYVRLHPDWVDDVIAKCYALLDRGMSLWITVSRRTPHALRERLRAAFPHKDNVWFWAGGGENPYLGFLAHADYFLVTADSVSMISEALYTDKPVALLRMPGEGKKFTRFYEQLFERNLTHWYDGDWNITAREQLCETERVAGILREKIKLI